MENRYGVVGLAHPSRMDIPKTTDYEKWITTQNKIDKATEKAFQKEMDAIFHLSEAESNAQDKRQKKEHELVDYIDKSNKKQSEFWNNMENFAYNVMDRTVDTAIDQMFANFFDKTQSAMDAWNEFGYKSGETWDNFSKSWNDSLEANKFSWKEFCEDLLKDFTSMLIKMELEAEAKNVYNLLTGKGYGGGGGKGGTIKTEKKQVG